jgi:serine/threonine protein kinase
MSDQTWNEDDDAPPSAPALLVDRYEIGRELGAGGFATVYLGRDVRTGRHVALKQLRGTGNDRQLRRELVALRYAKFPGVVRLLDDLYVDGAAWMVLDLVEGTSFPGEDLPPLPPPEVVRERTIRLLTILARLHRLGLAHQDLKPNNVLVTAAGDPVILDLGIASAGWLRAARGDGFEGTLRYAAPEQRRALINGSGYDRRRADLYAVGAMLYEALTGLPPHPNLMGRAAWQALVVADVDPPFPPLDQRRSDLPADLIAFTHRLLSADAADRPADATAALRALGVPAPVLPAALTADLPDPAPDDALRALFHGPEPLLHLPSRSARRLLHRTEGRAADVAAELQRWLEDEVVTLDGDRLRVDREALSRLEQEDGAAHPGTADDLWRRWPNLQISLLRARESNDLAEERRLLVEVTATAIQLEDADALDHALRLTDDESGDHDLARSCASLIRFWSAACVRRDPALSEAQALLAPDGFDDERLDAHLMGCRFMTAFGRDFREAEELLEDMKGWSAESRYREARRFTWLGLLRYRQLRFEESAAAHRAAADLRDDAYGRLVAGCNEILPLLDGGNNAQAADRAAQLVVTAADLGAPRFESIARTVVALASYRAGQAVPLSEVDLIDHAEQFFVEASAIATANAAEAWRAEDRVTLDRVSNLILLHPRRDGRRPAELLLRALRCNAGLPNELPPAEDLRHLPPRVRQQIAALDAGVRPMHPSGPRWEVLSDDELSGLRME